MIPEVAWVSDCHGGGYWVVAINTLYEKEFSTLEAAQNYQAYLEDI
jgi:hypothetical protein